jgi:hypothetical protein
VHGSAQGGCSGFLREDVGCLRPGSEFVLLRNRHIGAPVELWSGVCACVCSKKRASRLSRRQTRSGSTRPSCASTRAWNPSRRLRWQILAWGPPPEPERMSFAGQQNSPLSRCMTLEVTVVGSPVSRSQARPSPVETPPLVCLPPGSEPSSAASRRKTGTGEAVGLAVDR